MRVSERWAAVVMWLALLLLGSCGAEAASYEEALAKFAADSYTDTDAAIAGIAASGNPLAASVLEGLQDARLFCGEDKRIYLRDKSGTLIDAASGAPAPAATGLKPVRINNRIRRSIEAALGGLTLLAADPGKRLEAAQAVFKSKDLKALPALEQAIGREGDANVKRALNEARAAVLLYAPDAKESEKLEAIGIIRGRGDQDARGVLAALGGDQPETVRRAVADAISGIDDRLALWNVAQNLWYGLSLGSVLLLA